MRFILYTLSILGSFTAFSQQNEQPNEPVVQQVNGEIVTTSETTGNVTKISTKKEDKFKVKPLQRPERVTIKPQVEGEKKKNPTK